MKFLIVYYMRADCRPEIVSLSSLDLLCRRAYNGAGWSCSQKRGLLTANTPMLGEHCEVLNGTFDFQVFRVDDDSAITWDPTKDVDMPRHVNSVMSTVLPNYESRRFQIFWPRTGNFSPEVVSGEELASDNYFGWVDEGHNEDESSCMRLSVGESYCPETDWTDVMVILRVNDGTPLSSRREEDHG